MKEVEVLITKIETNGSIIDIGAEAAKAIPSHSRYRYKQPIKFTLQDNRVVESEIRATTKPKLKDFYESRFQSVEVGAVSAQMLGDQYMGYVTRLKIGL